MILGRPIGMGPVHYQKNKVNKCEEFHKLTCDPNIDKCCAVVRCEYCLSYDDAYGDTAIGLAVTEDGVSWFGAVNDMQVELTLFREYGSNYCYLRVIVDDVLQDEIRLCNNEGYQAGLVCSDFSSETEVMGGILRWYSQSKRKLPYVAGEDNCITQFCGDCECVCRELCVAIEDQETGPSNTGTLTMPEGDCGEPTWTGTASDGYNVTEITLTLFRDPEGRCRLQGTVGETQVESEPISDCKEFTGQIILNNGTRIGVRCKGCEDCSLTPPAPCCDYSLPETLNAQVGFGNCPAGPCNVDVVLTRRILRPATPPSNLSTIGWYGVAVSDCGNMQLVVACNINTNPPQLELYVDQCTGAPIEDWPTGFGQVAATVECDPFFMSGTSTPAASCCPGQTTLTTFTVTL